MSDTEADDLAEVAATAYEFYEGSRDMNYLHYAIWCYEGCLDALSKGHIERQPFLVGLVECLGDRYDRFKDTSDIENVILYSKELAEATPHDNPGRGGYLHTVSTWLSTKYTDMEDINDLDEAILYGQQAVAATPEDDPDRIEYLSGLAYDLGERYETTEDINDIEQAILYASEALAAAPVDDPGQVDRQKTLAGWHCDSYEKGGDITNLHQAISYAEAVVVAMQGDTSRASSIYDLSYYLGKRYDKIGDINDLHQAILYTRKALAIIPQGHVDRPEYSAALSAHLGSRFHESGSAYDLRQAILYCEEAVETAPRDQHNRSPYLISLVRLLMDRYKQTHDINSIEQVILMLEEAVAAEPPEDGNVHLRVLGSLSEALISRYLQIGRVGDICQAIIYARRVVAARPKGNIYQLAGLTSWMQAQLMLKTCLFSKAEKSDRSVNEYRSCIREILGECRELWETPESPSRVRMSATMMVSDITLISRGLGPAGVGGGIESEPVLFRDLQLGIGNLLVQNYIHQLPTVVSRTLGRGDQESKLSRVTAMTPLTASWAIEAGKTPYEVLELLELSRGLIMGFDIDCQSDISDLEATDPDLAAKFCDHRRRVDTGSLERATTISDRIELSFEHEVEYYKRQAGIVHKRQIAAHELEEMLVKIRKLPGYERFQRPLSADNLMAMAKDGPIVTFVSTKCRSDAIIITSSAISTLPLPDLPFNEMPNWLRFGAKIRPKKPKKSSPMPQTKEYAERNKRMRKQLLWLWDVAVEPVLRELKFTDPDPANTKLPHIWWIGVGQLSMAPFHVAGDHSPNSSRNTFSCHIPRTPRSYRIRERENWIYSISRRGMPIYS